MLLLVLVLLAAVVPPAPARRPCGGVFTAPRGLLQTPGFPGKFSTPAECEWLVKSDRENASIVVYLTQMYLHEGLTFTEYDAHDDRRLPGNLIEEVPAGEEVFQVKYVQSYKSALAIRLRLDSLDNVNLRVRDGFMDVYGFNITYEISAKVREDHCTVMDCQLNGYCYDYVTHFGCQCFEGYTGKHCLEGRKSACYKNGKPLCKNGATCRHIGDNGVMCQCASGFQGRLCEEEVDSTRNEHESDLCVSRAGERPCRCAPGDNLQQFKNDLQVFTVTGKLTDLPDMKEPELKDYIATEIETQVNHLQVKHVHIASFELSRANREADVAVLFYGPKTEEGAIARLADSWSTSRSIGRTRTSEHGLQLYHRPVVLSILSIAVSKQGQIHERDQFVLSCKIQASPNKRISWYKDGLLVNVSRTLHRWALVQKLDSTSQLHLAMLGIDEATPEDSGWYTCVAEDHGVRQCLSREINVVTKPEVVLDPMSLTVAKGQRFSIECSSDAKGQTSYLWAKNGELLPTRTKKEYYETLYLTGSLLKVNGLNKSANYSCLVHKGTVRQERSIFVIVVDPATTGTCASSNSSGVLWTETAAGYESRRQCPGGYYRGAARRPCAMRDNRTARWGTPDMSECVSDAMARILKRFQFLQLGYEATTPSSTLTETLDYVEKTVLLEGEGVVISNLIRDVAKYVKQSNYSENVENTTATAFSVINSILRQRRALVKEEQVVLLQRSVKELVFSSKHFLSPAEVFESRNDYLIANLYPVNQLTNFSSYLVGFGTEIKFRLKQIDLNTQYLSSSFGVVYKNLSSFLPTKSVFRLNDTEVNFVVSSDIAAVWYIDQHINDFELILNFKLKNASIPLNYTCVSAEYAPYYNWSPENCTTNNFDSTTIQCVCNKFGTFTVIGIEHDIYSIKDVYIPSEIIALVGCCICLLLAVVTTALLLFHWVFRRSSITFIKLQCSSSAIGAMSIFILGQSSTLKQEAFIYSQTFLQVFLLIGLSTQLSLLLIIYSDLLHLYKTKTNLKTTVICVVTGPALVTVFGNYLSHISMGLETVSWWVFIWTPSFLVFVICCCVLFLSYHMLYWVITKQIRNNENINISKNRIVLFHRSMYIFYAEIFVIFSSILYINMIQNIVCHILFSTASLILGILLIFCYILKSDDILEQYFLRRINETESAKKNNSLNTSTTAERFESGEMLSLNNDTSKAAVTNDLQSTRTPDILNSDRCAKLDLVSSNARTSQIAKLTKKKSQTKSCKCYAKKNNVLSRPQPGCSKKMDELMDEKNKGRDMEKNGEKTERKNGNIDEVMIGISEDLDYLLNRSNDVK